MNMEKIFWAFVVVVVVGMAALVASGTIVSPAYAHGQPQGMSCGGGAKANQLAAAPATVPQGGALAAVNNGVQEVSLSVQGGNYYPNPIRVKVGVPVKLVADMGSVTGCSRSIILPDFKVSKTVSEGDNVIEFTPDKSGTFSFSCSMGMYRGTLVVEEADGTLAATTGAAPKAAAGSCGMDSGGCGCGRAK